MGGIRNKVQVGKVTVNDGTKEDYKVFEHLYIKILSDYMNKQRENNKNQ